VALAAGIGVGELVSQFVGRPGDEPGPKLRRDCVSLVETAMNEDRTVPRSDLEQALTKRGINVPTFPVYQLSAEYEARKKEYDAKWQRS
jgi:hypothetical protein